MAWQGITYETARRMAREFLETRMFEVDPSRPGHESEIARTLGKLILDRMESRDSLVVAAVNDAIRNEMARRHTARRD